MDLNILSHKEKQMDLRKINIKVGIYIYNMTRKLLPQVITPTTTYATEMLI